MLVAGSIPLYPTRCDLVELRSVGAITKGHLGPVIPGQDLTNYFTELTVSYYIVGIQDRKEGQAQLSSPAKSKEDQHRGPHHLEMGLL